MSSSHQAPHPIAIRTLLRRYAAAWGRAVLAGRSAAVLAEGDPPEALLVDPFAGADHPLQATADPVPVGMVADLFRGVPAGAAARVRAVLLEEDPVKLAWLRDALRGVERVRRVGRLVESGEVEVVLDEGGGSIPEGVYTHAGGVRAALAVLDPGSARRLPWEQLLGFARQPNTDVLLRFPAAELRRLAAYRGMPLADLPPYPKRLVEGGAAMLGDRRMRWMRAWSGAATEGDDATAVVVDQLADRLRTASGRLVRRFVVPTDREGDAPEYLLLVAGAPSRVLLMNEVLLAARAAELLPWPDEPEHAAVRYAERGELELFAPAGAAPSGPAARERVVQPLALAHELATRFAGRTLTLDRLLLDLLDTDLLLDDIRRALTELRRDGRVLFRSLAQGSSELAFPRAGRVSAASRPAGRRRRHAETLTLALEPESE